MMSDEEPETKTIVIKISLYKELESMKIIPRESFNDVIQRIAKENRTLKEKRA